MDFFVPATVTAEAIEPLKQLLERMTGVEFAAFAGTGDCGWYLRCRWVSSDTQLLIYQTIDGYFRGYFTGLGH